MSSSYTAYAAHGYQITDDPHFLDVEMGITPGLHRKIERLYFQLQSHSGGTIRELKKLVQVYPNVPQLKNFLVGAYAQSGNMSAANEWNEKILTQHPDYLFGKVNAAFGAIRAGEFGRVEELVGRDWHLTKLFPGRDVFQIGEIIGFHKLAVYFYVKKKDLEQAENHFRLLTDIAPDHGDTEEANGFLIPLRMEKMAERWQEKKEREIKVEVVKTPPAIRQIGTPAFNHPEVEMLFKHGVDIPGSMLEELLELPKETLVPDLLAVLEYGASRYTYFSEGGWGESSSTFPLHALLLLKELEAGEALEQVLGFFEYDEDFLDFWLGDHLWDGVLQCLLVLGKNQSQKIKDFLLKPGVHANAKSAVSGALAQLGIHDPVKRAEVIETYAEVFEVFQDETPEGNLLDTVFLTYAVGDVVDAGYTELLPRVKTLCDMGYIDPMMHGPYSDIETDTKEYAQLPKKLEVLAMTDYYENVLRTWAGYREADQQEPNFPSYEIKQTLKPAVSQKVGRNDPCPCGSGKKYKKCCGAA